MKNYSNLFDEILIAPAAEKKANRLCIVSGYASPATAHQQLERLYQFDEDVCVQVLYGMAAKEGVPMQFHRQFVNLTRDLYPKSFSCGYILSSLAVHSKVYVWLLNDTPLVAYAGSANYSQNGFFNYTEFMTECSPERALEHFQELNCGSVSCLSPDVEKEINLYDLNNQNWRPQKKQPSTFATPAGTPENERETVTISLLDRRGNLAARSGLNWGQRGGREPNQAYIRVPVEVQNRDFFPERGRRFTVVTDDRDSFDAVTAQDNGKAIECPSNNSVIGRYFRKRLGLKAGDFVRKEDLDDYGRSDVKFVKLDDETYLLDFSV